MWGAIPQHLLDRGADVYLSDHQAWASIEDNAALLKNTVNKILYETGSTKINIIAHSKGGLESRYLISELGMGDRIATLTTVCTPHHGSPIADRVYNEIGKNKFFMMNAALWLDLLGHLQGDNTPNPIVAGHELTTAAMRDFNKKIKDDPRVYYQSYSAVISAEHCDAFWSGMVRYIDVVEGPNDGLVSVKSARWGHYRGNITTPLNSEYTHADAACALSVEQFVKIENNDVPDFYVAMVHELKIMGY